MEAKVTKLEMPVGKDVCKNLFKVDVKTLGAGMFGGFGFKTFGIYENEEVANFIAENIRQGKIIV
jgi:hypothetical protein